MPSWWGISSSKDVKKRTTKENFLDTLQRFISPTEQRGNVKSGGTRRRSRDTTPEKGSRSRAEFRSTSPSTQVSRCQSFADRPQAQPLPLPGVNSGITHTPSGINISKPMFEKRGKPPMHLPLPAPDRVPGQWETNDIEVDLPTASVSSNCSVDGSDDPADCRLHSPVGNGPDNGSRAMANNHSLYAPNYLTRHSCCILCLVIHQFSLSYIFFSWSVEVWDIKINLLILLKRIQEKQWSLLICCSVTKIYQHHQRLEFQVISKVICRLLVMVLLEVPLTVRCQTLQ